jgi:hypothetical protein
LGIKQNAIISTNKSLGSWMKEDKPLSIFLNETNIVKIIQEDLAFFRAAIINMIKVVI